MRTPEQLKAQEDKLWAETHRLAKAFGEKYLLLPNGTLVDRAKWKAQQEKDRLRDEEIRQRRVQIDAEIAAEAALDAKRNFIQRFFHNLFRLPNALIHIGAFSFCEK